jgi:UDP-glucose 4-epimerase
MVMPLALTQLSAAFPPEGVPGLSILVTGSAGHLGEALLRRLRAAGTPARGLDILTPLHRSCRLNRGSRRRQNLPGRRPRGPARRDPAQAHDATHSAQEFIDLAR